LVQSHPYQIEWHDDAAAYVKAIFALNQLKADIEATLEANPWPVAGDRVKKHMEFGRIVCCHRWREDNYRLLYEIFEDSRVVYVFDAGPRSDIYKGWW